MIPIVCVDENYGMLFNNRRQSKDQILRTQLLKITEGKTFVMNEYSASQFSPDDHIVVVKNPLLYLDKSVYCFIEDIPLYPIEHQLSELLVCKWNCRYPSDTKLDFAIEAWNKQIMKEFKGFSHEKITIERWTKYEEK